jgi:purine-binding chemotaxis protein CheW
VDEHLRDLPYVVLNLRDTLFAFSSRFVKSIIALPKVVPIPKMPDYFRGVINLRGQVIPLLDLRKRFGYKPLRHEAQELCDTLKLRQKDHENWITELKNSVEQHRQFSLATDPHKCAFGKWFDSYVSQNIDLMTLIKRFDKPHQAIHAVAGKVKQLEDQGSYDQGLAVIEQTRNRELTQMIKLFDTTCHYLAHEMKEIVLVLERRDGAMYAVAIDQVTSVEKLEEKSFEELSEMIYTAADNEPSICGFGIQERSGQYVQIIDPDLLLDTAQLRKSLNAVDDKTENELAVSAKA